MSDTSPTDTGLSENVASALCYLFGVVTGLVFFFIEKKNETVRFHAVQSIIVTIVMIVLAIAVWIVIVILAFIPVLGLIVGLLLSVVLGLACLGAWIGLMVLALTGRKVNLPFISAMAEKYSKPGTI